MDRKIDFVRFEIRRRHDGFYETGVYAPAISSQWLWRTIAARTKPAAEKRAEMARRELLVELYDQLEARVRVARDLQRELRNVWYRHAEDSE